MAKSVGLRARVEGLRELLVKLGEDAVLGEPWRKALQDSMEYGHRRAAERAPTESGALAASLTDRMDARAVPRWAQISTDLAGQDGVRFPFVLEAGRITSGKRAGTVLHYRRGPRAGKPTRKWLTGTISSIRRWVTRRMDEAAKEIERNWAR
jgi:hypothetical protein